MRAVVITHPGDPGVLQVRDIATPVPGTREVRVAVHAAGVNRADVLQRRGQYAAPASVAADVPGLEYAGVVDALDAGCTRFRPGDRVMGITGGGAYAESVVVHEEEAIPLPDMLDFVAGAAIPEAYITAHDALFTQARLSEGEWLLVHAAGSGVGIAAIQLALAAGARVIGTTRSAGKVQRIEALGAVAIDTARAEFVAEVMRITGGAGADVVLELVGGDYVARDLGAIALKGRIILVGLLAGRRAELDLGNLLGRRARVFGTVMRSRPLDEKIAAAAGFTRDVLPLFANGRIAPVVDKVFDLADAAAAHRYMESDLSFGKIVLTVSPAAGGSVKPDAARSVEPDAARSPSSA